MRDEERLIKLMIAYQAGEAEAFEELYRLAKPGLYHYLIIKTLDRQLAEELLQETFLQIHKARRTYIPRKPVTPWIYAIARHVYLSDRRSRVKRSYREESIENRSSDFPIPPGVDTVVEADNVWNALAALPPEQREAVLLHHYWGLSFKEIGATLGVRAGTAKLRAHRGLSKLRDHLSASCVTETQVCENRTVGPREP